MVNEPVVATYMHNLHPHTHPSFVPVHPPRSAIKNGIIMRSRPPPMTHPLYPLTPYTYSYLLPLSPIPTHPQYPNRLPGVEKCPCVPCGRWYWWKGYFPCCGCKQSPASPHTARVHSSEIHCTDYPAHWTPVVHMRGEISSTRNWEGGIYLQ